MDRERLERQMAFCLELDKEKNIGRQTYLSDGKRKENDAEHAWHLAVMAAVLQEYANTELDLVKTILMVLMHDVVEIDAGDTFAYDEEGKKTQKERESAAADRLYAILPPDQEKQFRDLWEEFEKNETPEAHFAHTLDNLQPTMLQAATDGRSWQVRGNRLSQVLGRNAVTPLGSETLWKYSYENFIVPQVRKGHLKDDVGIEETK